MKPTTTTPFLGGEGVGGGCGGFMFRFGFGFGIGGRIRTLLEGDGLDAAMVRSGFDVASYISMGGYM